MINLRINKHSFQLGVAKEIESEKYKVGGAFFIPNFLCFHTTENTVVKRTNESFTDCTYEETSEKYLCPQILLKKALLRPPQDSGIYIYIYIGLRTSINVQINNH